MSNCENCKLKCNMREVAMKAPTSEQRTAADGIVRGLESSESDCRGWSGIRLVKAVLFPDPPKEIMSQTVGVYARLMPPEEQACANPFRATDEYWELRADLEDANIAALGEDPSQFPTAQTHVRLAAHYAVIQQKLARSLGDK